MNEPRFLLDEDSICYGCQHYKHYTQSDDPNYWLDHEEDMDKNGGVCDSTLFCINGDANAFKAEKGGIDIK